MSVNHPYVAEVSGESVNVQPIANYECRRNIEADVVGNNVRCTHFRLVEQCGNLERRGLFAVQIFK